MPPWGGRGKGEGWVLSSNCVKQMCHHGGGKGKGEGWVLSSNCVKQMCHHGGGGGRGKGEGWGP